MEWKEKRTLSTDGNYEHIKCELWLKFEPSRWNNKTERPILWFTYTDKKKETGWWLDEEKTDWYRYLPVKKCEIYFNYLQSSPNVILYSKTIGYDNMTIEYCKQEAEKIIISRIENIRNQLVIKENSPIIKYIKSFFCNIFR